MCPVKKHDGQKPSTQKARDMETEPNMQLMNIFFQ